MKQRKAFTYEEVIDLLCAPSPKAEAVLLYLTTVHQATTGEIAKALSWDKSNTGRRLEALAEDGLVELVDDSHHEGKRGRPARLWRII
jgi:predicted ArsR family transcriptional regulator